MALYRSTPRATRRDNSIRARSHEDARTLTDPDMGELLICATALPDPQDQTFVFLVSTPPPGYPPLPPHPVDPTSSTYAPRKPRARPTYPRAPF